MSTNLSGNTLTLNNTSLNEETLKAIGMFYIPDNCKAGDTVILDGIECLCVATGVTIQGSSLTRIAVDKNHGLGYYQKYIGLTQDETKITQIRYWRWGGYGTLLSGGSYYEIGYGLQNTTTSIAKVEAYGNGSSTTNNTYPIMWLGVSDFRASHSDKWFVPSRDELQDYIYPYKSSLNFDATTGGSPNDVFWCSSEYGESQALCVNFEKGTLNMKTKPTIYAVRLCRAF